MENNLLVVAPHPDDEVLGCGGIIKKHSSRGDKVFVLIVTRGKKELYPDEKIINVRNEAHKAHHILGVTETIFMDYPAPDLDTIPIAELSTSISRVIMKYGVSTLFLPHRGDIHNDHKVVFHAGLIAARPVNDCPVRSIYAYETLSESEWAAPFCNDAFIPDLFVNITDFFDAKIDAMKCYKSQLRNFPNPRSLNAMEALSTLRGSTVGFIRAEAFSIIRQIEE